MAKANSTIMRWFLNHFVDVESAFFLSFREIFENAVDATTIHSPTPHIDIQIKKLSKAERNQSIAAMRTNKTVQQMAIDLEADIDLFSLIIRDNGCGLSADTMPALLGKVFSSTKGRGVENTASSAGLFGLGVKFAAVWAGLCGSRILAESTTPGDDQLHSMTWTVSSGAPSTMMTSTETDIASGTTIYLTGLGGSGAIGDIWRYLSVWAMLNLARVTLNGDPVTPPPPPPDPVIIESATSGVASVTLAVSLAPPRPRPVVGVRVIANTVPIPAAASGVCRSMLAGVKAGLGVVVDGPSVPNGYTLDTPCDPHPILGRVEVTVIIKDARFADPTKATVTITRTQAADVRQALRVALDGVISVHSDLSPDAADKKLIQEIYHPNLAAAVAEIVTGGSDRMKDSALRMLGLGLDATTEDVYLAVLQRLPQG